MEGARIQSTPTMVTPVDADRALRLRENKRRNRQRQKDYTAKLESRLRRLESEGIKATQEVQSAARKVIEDNSRLKALLRFKGVDEHTISTWTPEGETAVSDVSMPTRHGRCTTETTRHLSTQESLPSPLDEGQSEAFGFASTFSSAEPNNQTPCSLNGERAPSSECSTKLAPCKLMSRLAENPSTDLTQIEISDLQVEDNDRSGMECSKAYKLLMQFATNEEKLDTISQALESGCTKGSRGGCKVRNEAILSAIDEVS